MHTTFQSYIFWWNVFEGKVNICASLTPSHPIASRRLRASRCLGDEEIGDNWLQTRWLDTDRRTSDSSKLQPDVARTGRCVSAVMDSVCRPTRWTNKNSNTALFRLQHGIIHIPIAQKLCTYLNINFTDTISPQVAQLCQRDRAKLVSFSTNVQRYLQNH